MRYVDGDCTDPNTFALVPSCSEPQNQTGRDPREIEVPRSVEQVCQIEMQIAKRPEVAKLGTKSDVGPEEEHRAAAKVPGEIVLVTAQGVSERVDPGSNHPETYQSVRAKSDAVLPDDRNAEQQIASRGQNAAAAEVGLAEEVRLFAISASRPRTPPPM